MFSLNYPTKTDYIIYKYSTESQNILSKQTSPLIILDKLNVGMYRWVMLILTITVSQQYW